VVFCFIEASTATGIYPNLNVRDLLIHPYAFQVGNNALRISGDEKVPNSLERVAVPGIIPNLNELTKRSL